MGPLRLDKAPRVMEKFALFVSSPKYVSVNSVAIERVICFDYLPLENWIMVISTARFSGVARNEYIREIVPC